MNFPTPCLQKEEGVGVKDVNGLTIFCRHVSSRPKDDDVDVGAEDR